MICVTSFLVVALQSQAPAAPPAREHRGDAADAPRTSDPFQPDEALRHALGLDTQGRNADGFSPLADAPPLPGMRLRAYAKLAHRPQPAAVVEITGVGTFTVHAGEKLSFSLPGRFVQRPPERREPDTSAPVRDAGVVVREQIPIVLRIERVAPDGVVVEVGTLGEFLIIR